MRKFLFLITLLLNFSAFAEDGVVQNSAMQEQEVGTVYVYRNQFPGSAGIQSLLINGALVSNLQGYSCVKVSLKPRSYDLSLKASSKPAFSLNVVSGKDYYLFAKANMFGQHELVLVDVAVGKNEVLKLQKKFEVTYDDIVNSREKLIATSSGKAVAIVYNAWRSSKVPLSINKLPLAELSYLNYLRITLKPGLYEIESGDGILNLPLNAEAGQIYYIFQGISGVRPGLPPNTTLKFVDASTVIKNSTLEMFTLLADFDFDTESPPPFILRDSSTYQGEFKNALPNGKGKIAYSAKSDLESYEGEVKSGVPDGVGTFIFKNGVIYTGDVLDGKAHGKGVAKLSDGATYEGDFYKNVRHGKGLFKFANGNQYDGDIKKNQPDGHGKYTRADGSFIVGEFKEGKFVSGKFYTSTGNLIQNDVQSNNSATSPEVSSFLSDLAIFTLNMTNAILTGYNKSNRGYSSPSLNSELLNSDSPLKNNVRRKSDFGSDNTTQQAPSVYDSSNQSESYKSSGCTSDFNCGTGFSCVKKAYSNDGVCMKSVDSSGVPTYSSPSTDSIGVRTSNRCNFDTDCPVRFRCDANLKACVQ